MNTPLRVVLWNANGLSNHKLEFQTLLDMHKIDIALISENPHYSIYIIPYTLTIPHTEAQHTP